MLIYLRALNFLFVMLFFLLHSSISFALAWFTPLAFCSLLNFQSVSLLIHVIFCAAISLLYLRFMWLLPFHLMLHFLSFNFIISFAKMYANSNRFTFRVEDDIPVFFLPLSREFASSATLFVIDLKAIDNRLVFWALFLLPFPLIRACQTHWVYSFNARKTSQYLA